MDYERIDKVQTGVISPSKLRLKLLGSPNRRRKEGGSNSSRTSPSKLEDAEFANNSLLAAENEDFHVQGSALDVVPLPISGDGASNAIQGNQTGSCSMDIQFREISNAGRVKVQKNPKGVANQVQFSSNSRTVHPVKHLEEDSADYDSGVDNASTSSFEFHKGERTLHNPMVGPFSRPVPSKWNDAEKWIMNRQIAHPNVPKKTIFQSQANRQATVNWTRVAPDSMVTDQRDSVAQVADTKRIDSCQPSTQIGLEKFSFTGPRQTSGPTKGMDRLTDQCPGDDGVITLTKDWKEENHIADTTTVPSVRSVSMRDMGTEMTPMTSQEPSRTGTPVGATTPIRSPVSSIPSTPRRGAPAPSPAEAATDDELGRQEKKELSEKELQEKTRREIVALGVQLGKMNIAAWASKEEKENTNVLNEAVDAEQLQKLEFENRAAAWEEAEKSKHMARYKREEIKIQAWEYHQRAKLEAEIKRTEAHAEQTRSHAQEKMMNKLAITRQRSEEKRAAAEARKNQEAMRTVQQADYIRQTGRIPSSHFLCCKCFP
ncbi:uncharacterized protein LOC131220749 [Magnolia sinica]|uniref:uncharacterized protein LOC131220749 n=1 Tax=Magnolia sinica TaxID=86752 RepID=UPI00265B3704|nr:uncharacterized protein LOC131220749 [Magnolia sinica]